MLASRQLHVLHTGCMPRTSGQKASDCHGKRGFEATNFESRLLTLGGGGGPPPPPPPPPKKKQKNINKKFFFYII